MDIEWDPWKAQANLREHGSATGVLLVVVYTHREPAQYRLISSWKANKPQRKQYEKTRR